MDLAAFCVTYVELKIAPTDSIWLFSVYTENKPATVWLPTIPSSTPYRSACGIGIASDKLSKMAGNLTSYTFNSWCTDHK